MEEILHLLSESDIIQNYEVLNVVQDEDFYYLKIRSQIIDSSILYIKIYLSDKEYNYSFHWQKEAGELIVRWDNAPHHLHLKTFPHHRHSSQNITESFNITLSDILKEIKQRLKKGE